MSGNRYVGDHYYVDFGPSALFAPSWTAYNSSVSVRATLKEVMPDTYSEVFQTTPTYTGANYLKRYRVLRFELSETVLGYNVPDEFFYLIPEGFSTNLWEYDEFILLLEVVGAENHLLINTDKSRIEAFSYVFYSGNGIGNSSPEKGRILPFSDGVIDMSLWEKEGWNGPKNASKDLLGDGYKEGFDIYPYSTVDDVIEEIRDYANIASEDSIYNRYPELFTVFTLPVDLSDEVTEYLEYIKPFEQGVYLRSLPITVIDADGNKTQYIEVTRLINGFQCGESARIDLTAGTVEFSGEKYSSDERIPDVGAMLEDIDLDAMMPLHTPGYEKLERLCAFASGVYAKVDGEVYGIVRAVFTYKDNAQNLLYRDSTFLILDGEGKVSTIEREELKDMIGDNAIIDRFKYGVGEYIPMF